MYKYANKFYNLSKNYDKVNLYYCLLLLGTTQVRGFRTLFGYPVNGQRTWSNARTSKKKQELVSYKWSVYTKLNQGNEKPTEVMFLAEYINLF